ncbi:MAG TPA: Rrf2 family transcriptional regulator [Deinococcales bacterium]|nr:Rrf2 family transcriptional regulator [Deinococcales bacterium]
MWISTKAQYGLRALIEIAKAEGSTLALKNVAEKQEISQHYLEQIAAALRRSGFIRSVRGAHGGYRLARPAASITALEVVQAMEGSLAPVSCVDDPSSCGHHGGCATEGLWRRVDIAVRGVLASTTLADLMTESQLLQAAQLIQLTSPGQASA